MDVVVCNKNGVSYIHVEFDGGRADAAGQISKIKEKGTIWSQTKPLRPDVKVLLIMRFLLQKKALQAHKAPKQETEKPLIPKRAVDARDAREVARKLFKSGAITAIQKPHMKQDQMSFKRPKGQERKRIVPDINVASYQPFSSTQGSDTFPTAGGNTPDTDERDSSRIHNCNLIAFAIPSIGTQLIQFIFSVSAICYGTRSRGTWFDGKKAERYVSANAHFTSCGKTAHRQHNLCVRQ